LLERQNKRIVALPDKNRAIYMELLQMGHHIIDSYPVILLKPGVWWQFYVNEESSTRTPLRLQRFRMNHDLATSELATAISVLSQIFAWLALLDPVMGHIDNPYHALMIAVTQGEKA